MPADLAKSQVHRRRPEPRPPTSPRAKSTDAAQSRARRPRLTGSRRWCGLRLTPDVVARSPPRRRSGSASWRPHGRTAAAAPPTPRPGRPRAAGAPPAGPMPSSRTRRWCRPGSCAPTVVGPRPPGAGPRHRRWAAAFDSGAALTRPTSRTSFTPTIPGSSPGTTSACACFLAMTPAKAAAHPHARASRAPVDDGTKRPHHVDAATARCEQSGTAGSRRRHYSDMSEEFATQSWFWPQLLRHVRGVATTSWSGHHYSDMSEEFATTSGFWPPLLRHVRGVRHDIRVLATTTQTCPSSRHEIRGGFWPPLLRHVRVVVPPRAARWTSWSARLPVTRDVSA